MATLTTTISEAVTINSQQRGSTNVLTITGIEHTFERVVTIPASADSTVLLTKDTIASSDGAVDIQDTKYIRITNLESSNPAILSLQIDTAENDSDAADQASIYLEAGKSFIMGVPHEGIEVDSTSKVASVATATLLDLESIIVDPFAAAVKVEVFIASVVA